MKRAEKKEIIATQARKLAAELARCDKDNQDIDIGTSHFAVRETGEIGNVFGIVLARAGFGHGRKIKGGNCAFALKMVLGLKDDETLPKNVDDLLQSIEITTIETGPGKTYSRKTDRLSKTLTELADALVTTQIGRSVGYPAGRPRVRTAA